MESTTKAEGIKEESQPIGKAHDLNYYLIKERNNWADEINIEGFVVIETEDIEQWKEDLISDQLLEFEQEDFPIEISIGTNESIEFKSKKEVFDTLEITEISMVQYQFFKKHFKRSFGVSCWLRYL
jgi:hypothetical protein